MSEPTQQDDPPGLAWRMAIGPALLLGGVMAVLVLSKLGLITGTDNLTDAMETLRGASWSVPALIGVFCLGAYLGVPQFVLMAGAVAAFGPVWGFGWGWVATLCSGSLTFWTGRLGGEALFRRYAGARANQVSAFLGRNGFVASLLIRLVPTAPFIVVNMAFGVSRARFLAFLGGLGIGALPKLALVAFAGQGLVSAGQGATAFALGLVAAAIAIWLLLAWLVRTRYLK